MGRNYYNTVYPEISCGYCGKSFRPKQWNQKYCCRECKDKKHKEETSSCKLRPDHSCICKTCGKNFNSSHPHALYCSDDCRHKKPKKNKQQKPKRRFVYAAEGCPNLSCNWLLDCGGGKSVCLRAKCNNGVVFT